MVNREFNSHPDGVAENEFDVSPEPNSAYVRKAEVQGRQVFVLRRIM